MNKDILLASKVKEKGGRAFYVGGYVRDLLLNIPNKDIDIEVHGIAEKDLVAILNEIGEVDYYGRSFGIYALRHEDIEVALPRSEKVLGTGHRDFEISVDPDMGYKNAALRRDFTINALMMDVLSHEILDYFKSLDEISLKVFIKTLYKNGVIDGLYDFDEILNKYVYDKFEETSI